MITELSARIVFLLATMLAAILLFVYGAVCLVAGDTWGLCWSTALIWVVRGFARSVIS